MIILLKFSLTFALIAILLMFLDGSGFCGGKSKKFDYYCELVGVSCIGIAIVSVFLYVFTLIWF